MMDRYEVDEDDELAGMTHSLVAFTRTKNNRLGQITINNKTTELMVEKIPRKGKQKSLRIMGWER